MVYDYAWYMDPIQLNIFFNVYIPKIEIYTPIFVRIFLESFELPSLRGIKTFHIPT
jgi:hypothetical protein